MLQMNVYLTALIYGQAFDLMLIYSTLYADTYSNIIFNRVCLHPDSKMESITKSFVLLIVKVIK
ncbi:hypothetical protein F984_00990 [Acinetobacter nosocomialis NIPH 2119]|nr:hypothetical protein F984_00990 [Acinetobacter nosocomialis NIPH 2119]